MKISVFMDDYRLGPSDHILVKNIDDCLVYLENYQIAHLSLDHDLVSKHRNGYLLVQTMVERQLFADRITIHSANAPRGKAMFNYLKQAQKDLKMPQTIVVKLRPLPLH
ncbi:MAG: cyclic-phosphate processing receiver domain-containing protein [Bacillus sp. (in: firmicutes)]